jgi:hypothetical protein
MQQIAEETQPDTPVTNVACAPQAPPTHLANIIDPERYGSLTKLLRITALVMRFVRNARVKDRDDGLITAKEITNAEQTWISNIQHHAYQKEITSLQKEEKNNDNSQLARQLCLFLDSDGLLKVGGRLHNAPLDYASKFPILIPAGHFTKLLILAAHENVCHAGLQSTITHLRQRFWITKIRVVVKSIIRNCVTCKKVVGKPYRKPIPAPLQSFRLLEAPPFTITGVDFTGALYVTDGKNETKAYICLFTCAVTRAIHLELVMDMTTETFLRAFRRFVGRRSLPNKMVSDNASTFLAAADELGNLFNSPVFQNYLANRRVEWVNIPKRAPWWGGFWERLIGLTKTSLKKVLGRAFVSADELNTILVEIEAGLNDRPLTYVYSDSDDLPPLTPSHFLHGRPITTVPYRYTADYDELADPTFGGKPDLITRYERIGKLQSHFWKRWSQEYLSALREQDRLSGKGITHNQINVGDVVLIEDKNVPRLKWHMAVVEELIQGHDGLIRSVNVKTKTGTTSRPIAKLYPLEVNSSVYNNMNTGLDKTNRPKLNANTQLDTSTRPKRNAAIKAAKRINNWAKDLNSY